MSKALVRASRGESGHRLSVILECVGVPGSGKSTVVRELQAFFDGAINASLPVTRFTFRARFYRKIRAAIQFRKLLTMAMRSLLTDRRPIKWRMRSLRWFLTTLEAYTEVSPSEQRNGITLLSEGTIQRSLLLCYDDSGHIKETLLTRYLELAPVADIVIRLDIPISVAAARNVARNPDTRFTRRPEPLDSVLHEIDGFLTDVLAKFSATRDLRTVYISSTEDSAIKALQAEIHVLLRSSPSTL